MAAPVPRIANAVLGLGIAGFMGSVYWYSMRAVADVRVQCVSTWHVACGFDTLTPYVAHRILQFKTFQTKRRSSGRRWSEATRPPPISPDSSNRRLQSAVCNNNIDCVQLSSWSICACSACLLSRNDAMRVSCIRSTTHVSICSGVQRRPVPTRKT